MIDKNKRIVILEDQSIVALDIELLFTNNGFTNISSFSSGKKAIENINLIKPDLALLDIKLKGEVTGLDVAEVLKKLNVEFIFVSAFSDQNNYLKALNLNPAQIIYKPFKVQDLLKTVETVLNKKK